MGRYYMRLINGTAWIRRMSKRKLIAIGVAFLVLCISSAVTAAGINVTYVFSDNVQHKVVSFTDNPEKIVEKAGVTLDGENELYLDFYNPEEDWKLIFVAQPHNVTIYEGDKLLSTVNVAGTVETALMKAGITLNDGDELSVNESVGITSDMEVKITRSFPVTVKADGKETTVNVVTGATVGEVLRKAGITVGEKDIVSLDEDKALTEKTSVKVKRVTFKTKKKTVRTAYSTKVEYSNKMYEDQRRIKKKGVKGKKIEEYYNTYIDGKLHKSKLVKTTVVKKPVTEVIVRGTKLRSTGYTGSSVKSRSVISELSPPFKIKLNKNGRPVKYKRVITGQATAYSGGGITSTGARAMPGRVAVDPREIPYGTKMYIVSSDGRWNYGYAVAADTGGFIYNSRTVVDIYMHSEAACRNFGRRNVDIYILEWG